MANGAFKFKDNSGNVVSFISGSGSNISFSGGTLDLSGMTGLTLGNLTLSGTTQNALSASHAASYLLTSSFNTYSGTTDTVIGTLQTSTSSLNSFTSSATTRLNSIETSTGSLNSYTSSNNTKLGVIESTTGSLNSYTSSNTTNINAIHTSTSSLNTFTSSATTRLNSIETSTGSLNGFTSSTNNRLNSIETSTGSLNSFTSSATTRLNSIEGVSGSYATTGSNQFKNDQVITGSLTVTGFIDAQELRTTYISSSILYRSGSTKFGDELTDTHAFTGSLLVSGSISVPGSNLVSGSSQVLNGSGVFSGSAQLPSGIVSSSAQTIANLPSGVVSGSAQTIANLPSGTVSGSVQVDVMSTTNIARLATTGSNVFTGAITGTTATFSGDVTIKNTSTSANLFIDAAATGGSEAGLYFKNGGTNKWENYTANNDTALNWYSYANSTIVFKLASTGAATFSSGVEAASFYTNDTRYIANQIQSGYNANSEDSDIWINYTGYQGGTTRFRDFRVGNGKQGQIALFDGSTGGVTFSGNLTLSSSSSTTDLGGVLIVRGNGSAYSTHYLTTGAANVAKYIQYDASGNAKNEIFAGGNSYITGGNFGIGSTTPNYPLHVYKSSGTSAINVESISGQNSQYRLEEAAVLKFAITYVPSDSSTRFYFAGHGTDLITLKSSTVLIATTTPSGYGVLNTYKAPVASNFVDQIVVQGTGNYPSLRLGTYDTYDGVIATTGNDLRILSGLNVTTENHNIMFYTSFIGGTTGAQNYERMRIAYNGSILVNTTTPISNNKMYVALSSTETFRAGTWETQSYDVNNAWIGENVYYDNNFKYRISGYAYAFYSDGSSGAEIRVAPNGGTGTNITWRNGATFAPNGNVYNYSNTTTWQQTSDIKIKENINSLLNGLDVLSNLRPVTFDYKEEFSNSINWEEERRLNNVGFIAQEFEETFPKYVGSSERRINGEFETLKNIDTSHLTPYLVRAIQELKVENDNLKDILTRNNLS